jgi:hypothetical protein
MSEVERRTQGDRSYMIIVEWWFVNLRLRIQEESGLMRRFH